MFSYKYDAKQKHVLSLAVVVKMSLLAGGKEASASRESCLLAPGPGCSKRGQDNPGLERTFNLDIKACKANSVKIPFGLQSGDWMLLKE